MLISYKFGALGEEKLEMFRNRLTKVFRHRDKQARQQGISCYRVYDHDLPEFPFCIDIYGDQLYIAEYLRRHRMTKEQYDLWTEASLEVISEVLSIRKENIYLKLRQRKPGRLGQYQKLHKEGHEFIVEEGGLRFIVNLSDYLDTGLFLDHRITRQMVREESKGKKVLNLFAYTGSFSVYAAFGGAEEVITVDLSKTYLDWAKRNMGLNGFIFPDRYKYIHQDVVKWLESAPPDHFDIVILDPPTFSNSKRMEEFLDIQRDHSSLINRCLDAMQKGGKIFFSSNFSKLELDLEKINSGSIKEITSATTPFDFQGKINRRCWLISK